MELYLLKSTLALSILYSIYWLLLRNETYFRINRIYLLSSLLISFLAPLLKFNLLNGIQQSISYLASPIVINASSRLNTITETKGSIGILSIIYTSGIVFFSLRFLSRLSHIYYLYNRFPKVRFNGFRTVIIDGNQSPFTFFSILFLSSSDYKENKLTEMIIHEKAHKDQFHSFDLILLEFMTILQWFNPFVWLLRVAIKAEHEFLADENVLKAGFDKVTYQRLLFEKSLGVTALGVTSNFNYSLLKNRLKMMTIKKSGLLAKVKYSFTLPLLLSVCFLLSFNFKLIAQQDVYKVVEKMPVYGSGENDLRNFISQNLKYPESAAKLGIQGKIFISFVVTDQGSVKDVKVIRTILIEKDKNGKSTELIYTANGNTPKDAAIKDMEKEGVRVFSLLGKFTPGENGGKPVNVEYTLPLTFVLN